MIHSHSRNLRSTRSPNANLSPTPPGQTWTPASPASLATSPAPSPTSVALVPELPVTPGSASAHLIGCSSLTAPGTVAGETAYAAPLAAKHHQASPLPPKPKKKPHIEPSPRHLHSGAFKQLVVPSTAGALGRAKAKAHTLLCAAKRALPPLEASRALSIGNAEGGAGAGASGRAGGVVDAQNASTVADCSGGSGEGRLSTARQCLK